MTQKHQRARALEQHRMIGLFGIIQCWLTNLDGLIIQRNHLTRLLDLKYLRNERVEWLQNDLYDYFPYQKVLHRSEKNDFGSLCISRVPLKDLPSDPMKIGELAFAIPPNGPKIDQFKLWAWPTEEQIHWINKVSTPLSSSHASCDEQILSLFLSSFAQGLISPKSLPMFQDKFVFQDLIAQGSNNLQ